MNKLSLTNFSKKTWFDYYYEAYKGNIEEIKANCIESIEELKKLTCYCKCDIMLNNEDINDKYKIAIIERFNIQGMGFYSNIEITNINNTKLINILRQIGFKSGFEFSQEAKENSKNYYTGFGDYDDKANSESTFDNFLKLLNMLYENNKF